MTLNDLKPGQRGHLIGWHGPLPDRLLEMGMLPGTLLEVVRIAPFGDPIALRVQGSQLAIRRQDAALLQIEAA